MRPQVPHSRVQTEPVGVGAKGLPSRSLPRHRAPQGQKLLHGTGPEGDAIRDGRGLQRPQRAGLAPSASGSARLVWPISSISTPRRVSIFISRVMTVCSSACSSSSVSVLDSTKTGRPEARDQRHGAAVALVGLQPGAVQQVAGDHALHHLQHRSDQPGLSGQQQAQRDRQRQHPLPHRHVRDDVVDQVGRSLRHAARAA